jgi:hypothetical protein
MTMDIPPDEVLLELFDFHLKSTDWVPLEAWHTLVHVCRNGEMAKHRSVILNLQILCGDGTPVRKMLDIWPAFLIVVCNDAYSIVQDGEIIVDALEHDDCVCEIDFNISSTNSVGSNGCSLPRTDNPEDSDG